MTPKNAYRVGIMALTLATLSMFASLMGVFHPTLYLAVYHAGTLPHSLIWGSKAQDIVSIPVAAILAMAAYGLLGSPGMRTATLVLGLSWYFFYAFGLYTIQGQYTAIYPVYMAIFGLSFYAMVIGVLSLTGNEAMRYPISDRLRRVVSMYLLAIVAFLYPVWILRMLPDIARNTPSPAYGVFVLDLCLVFPALGIIALMLRARLPLGDVLAGAALIKVLTLCLSWAFGEFSNPLVGGVFVPEMALLSGFLTVSALLLLVPYMTGFKAR